MCIRYHFLANLHITETHSILFLTKYDKNNIMGWAKACSKTGFSVNDWKLSKTLWRLKQNYRFTLISGWGELFSEWENFCPGQHGPKAICNCVPLRSNKSWTVRISQLFSTKLSQKEQLDWRLWVWIYNCSVQHRSNSSPLPTELAHFLTQFLAPATLLTCDMSKTMS